ncbi:MAG: WGR domain-containing protein, partial [Candidatus Methanoplasma sp.]|nr:WGR domain-containing protein [Candidatus Methanoplasma sp.]
MRRNFVYKDEKSNKFWSIDVDGSNYTVTYGKVGTDGQTSEKTFET